MQPTGAVFKSAADLLAEKEAENARLAAAQAKLDDSIEKAKADAAAKEAEAEDEFNKKIKALNEKYS